jgi:hypothetical protein
LFGEVGFDVGLQYLTFLSQIPCLSFPVGWVGRLHHLSGDGDLNLNTSLDVDDDLLDDLGGGVKVDQALVDPVIAVSSAKVPLMSNESQAKPSQCSSSRKRIPKRLHCTTRSLLSLMPCITHLIS